ncbi:hypothetical protein [Allosphingosinicella sp.]|uniref:hypothetical protein n=1 Tax=Allosphingosinicella sp. TaxID=2823234 RepID=UPI002EF1F34F
MHASPVHRGRRICFAASLALTVALVPAPALAGESRATLGVTATVLPTCRVQSSSVRCSAGEMASAARSLLSRARPLAQASALLGHPALRGGRLFLTAHPVAGATAAEPARAPQPYLTITY